MDSNTEVVPFNVLSDSYNLFVPIVDDELMKSVQVNENGDYIVQGIMSSDDVDEEDDSISPTGMDCSYFLEKGWIKYEHGNKPEQFIGEPMEVKVGQFKHPKTQKSVNGIYVKGRLFANRSLARQAVQAMQEIQKSLTSRTMGWSIEGNVAERDKNGKIVKSILRNVVLTMNPINTTTWAELAKSFAKDHELTINTDEPVQKAMDIAGAQAIMPQSLEGAKPSEDDEQAKWVKAFQDFCRSATIDKALYNTFITSPDEAQMLAFEHSSSNGLDYEEAEQFASYIAEKYDVLKALVTNLGGENMDAFNLLDTELEELKKSIATDEDDSTEDEDDDELEKSVDADDDSSEDDESEEGESDDEDADGDDGDEEEKSFKTNLSKSLATDDENAHAMEVSDFLTNFVDEIGYHFEGVEKSMGSMRKQNNVIANTLVSVVELTKSLVAEMQEMKTHNESLEKSLGEALNRPVGRKGVVNNRELQTLSKSMTGDEQPLAQSRNQVLEILEKSFDEGDLNGSVITKYEAGAPLDKLALPASVRKKLGMSN